MVDNHDPSIVYTMDGDRLDERDQRIKDLELRIILSSSLELRIRDFERRENNEAYLRERNPSLQDAWEKYQTILRLVKHA